MPELVIDIDEKSIEQIDRLAKRLDAAWESPTMDADLDKAVRDASDVHANNLLAGLQALHNRSITSFKGGSFRSIRAVAKSEIGKTQLEKEAYANAATPLIDHWVSVGYFPRDQDARDTSAARKVQAYFGGVEGSKWITGSLLKGIPPGRIKAPRKGVAGAFGGIGWERLRAYLMERESTRFGTASHFRTTKAEGKRTPYKSTGHMQDIWAIVRRWELRGILPTPIVEDFFRDVVPKEARSYAGAISRAFWSWWNSLGP